MNPKISINLNVSLIDKTRLFEGKKGKYLNLILIPTPNSDFGDWMIVHDSKKQERDAGYKSAILGNGKLMDKQRPDGLREDSRERQAEPEVEF